MSDPKKLGEAITIPTDEEQEAITGGRIVPGEDDRSDMKIDPEQLDRKTRPKFDPGGPPQLRRIHR